MEKVKVLVVDDSVVIRRLVSDILGEVPEIEVVGVAANGKIALTKIPDLRPDVVTLDIEMPEMDGLETLSEIRKQWVKLPVIMFSTLTERGGAATMKALTIGANDYVTKPANVGSVSESMKQVRDALVPKILALAGHTSQRAPAPPPRSQTAAAPRAGRRQPVEIVAIGSSTGGPAALSTVLEGLPNDFASPILVVQHMPKIFTRLLAERLDRACGLSVREASDGEAVAPGTVLIAPGEFHMTVGGSRTSPRINLSKSPPVNSCRPAVDPMFESVAELFGRNALALVLTGMGQDGLGGCHRLREKGATVLVQDAATSVVWGMPGAVATAGLADEVLPLDSLAGALFQRVGTLAGA